MRSFEATEMPAWAQKPESNQQMFPSLVITLTSAMLYMNTRSADRLWISPSLPSPALQHPQPSSLAPDVGSATYIRVINNVIWTTA